MIGYHGTSVISAESILSYGFIIPKNKKYWLGEGVYFFTEDIYAFKWILDIYKYSHKNVDFKKLIREMTILKVNLEISPERLFDLSTFKDRVLFDRAYKYMKQSGDKRISKLLNTKYIATAVIDFLFKKMELCDQYDAVKEIYRINRKNYEYILKDTHAGLPQCQICVKNLEVIKDIKRMPYEKKISDYLDSWNALISTQPLVEIINSKGDNGEYNSLTNNDQYIFEESE